VGSVREKAGSGLGTSNISRTCTLGIHAPYALLRTKNSAFAATRPRWVLEELPQAIPLERTEQSEPPTSRYGENSARREDPASLGTPLRNCGWFFGNWRHRQLTGYVPSGPVGCAADRSAAAILRAFRRFGLDFDQCLIFSFSALRSRTMPAYLPKPIGRVSLRDALRGWWKMLNGHGLLYHTPRRRD
jgi:hypothetical protein